MVTSFYRIGGQPLIFSLQGDFSKDFSKDFSSRRFLRKEISLEEDISGRRFLFNKISQEEDFSVGDFFSRRFLRKKMWRPRPSLVHDQDARCSFTPLSVARF